VPLPDKPSVLNTQKDFMLLKNRLPPVERSCPLLKFKLSGLAVLRLPWLDENKRAIYYNEEFRDVIIKALAMKCRWQIRKFQLYTENIICFIDEPILSAFGSSTYVSVKREDIVAHLSEIIDVIHADNTIAAIHCCGNTEWSILMDAGVDIVNFDAFSYGETIASYPEDVKKHFSRGGMLAWGIIPTSIAIREHTVESLMDHLASKGIDKQ
jgi:hypothetical protein